MSMNTYVLKGVILDACKQGDAGSALKCRLFDAISYPGFVHSTYNVIGVEFGLGVMVFDDEMTGEPTTVKVQLWNLNEQHQFTGNNMDHFLRGSRFTITCWEPDLDADGAALRRTTREIIAACPKAVLVIASIASCEGVDAREIIESVMDETCPGATVTVARSTDGLMQGLTRDCIHQRAAVYHLPLTAACDILPATSIENPFNTYVTRASDHLLAYLATRGMPVEKHCVFIDAGAHRVRINLENSSMHARLRECEGCTDGSCHHKDTYTKICVVLDSHHCRGWASGGTGLTDTDLFILAMIQAASAGALPASITNQFPACPRKRKGWKRG